MSTRPSPAPPLFFGKTSLAPRALLVGERLDLRALEVTQRLAITPLVVPAGDSGCAVLFRYGAAVLFDLSPVEEAAFLTNLRPLVVGLFARFEVEEAQIRIDPGREEWVENGVIFLHEPSVERIQIVADALAKSVVLAHYESTVAAVFDRVEPLAESMERVGSGREYTRQLLRHIGGSLLIQQKMVGRVEVEEKPEILWDRPELERLYLTLLDEYELSDRHKALGRKLELITRTAETSLNLLHHRHSLRVEWYIVILILVDIILSLYSLFFKR